MEENIENPFKVVPFTKEHNEGLLKYFDAQCKCVFVGLPSSPIFVIPEDYHEATEIYRLPVLPTDVFVNSFPRSGSTWTQELIWLLLNDLDFEKAKSTPLSDRQVFLERPVLTRRNASRLREMHKNDAEKLAYLEYKLKPPAEIWARTPSPRTMLTHLPPPLLPKGALEIAKVVVSVMVAYTRAISVLWGPQLDHVKEAWKLRNHPNMLIIFYEELSKDLVGTARRVASFLGKQYSEHQLLQLADFLAFDNFQKNDNYLAEFKKLNGIFDVTNNFFIRKGVVGGWRSHFDAELSAQATRWMQLHLQDTDLRFPNHE